MAIIATGSKTIIDLSDGKSLSAYLGSNQPRTQIHDVNANTYQPNWTTTAGKLVITPVVYANQTAIALTNAALSITWKRREGSGSEAALASGESVSSNVLTVSQNKLASVSSGLLTYIAYVTYTDPDTGLPINATADITFALVSTGENAKSAWISGEQVFKYDKDGNVSPAQITLTANALKAELAQVEAEMSIAAEQISRGVRENAVGAYDQSVYRERHNALCDRYDSLKARCTELKETIFDKQTRLAAIDVFLRTLMKQETLITTFDPMTYHILVERMTVYSKDKVIVRFKNGMEIQA